MRPAWKHDPAFIVLADAGVIDTAKLRPWFFCHRWNDALEAVGVRLYCSRCRGRPVSLRPTPAEPDRPEWMEREHD